ncbi:expressed unknown protein [Seminavis robusta]|uniref:BTB domain-containing protein n=1 Tax=Seminavis robusta TaxID=568900 RepID=A0A9N8HGE9_9STRA|nr:expressed unknown protein [Seminavis robusta]|eukprot:Sro629_g178210.1 n/a (457) ;mRNA; r:36830-38200
MSPSSGMNSFEQSFLVLLEDDSFHNVILVGNDDIGVSANRMALAVRCGHFQRMFMGNFQESNKEEVYIEKFAGNVIKSIVQYLHTNKAEILECVPQQQHDNKTDATADEAHQLEWLQALVSLANAAIYFDIPSLQEATQRTLRNSAKSHPLLAFAALESYEGQQQSDLETLALSTIRSNPEDVSASAVRFLSASALERILQGLTPPPSPIHHHQIWELIHGWAGGTDTTTTENNHAKAKQFVSDYVDLPQIRPDVLSAKVEPSGLADHQQLYQAYRAQALATTRLAWKHGDSDEFCPTPSHKMAILDHHRPITSGTYQWTLAFSDANYVMVGIVDAYASPNLAEDFSVQKGTWGCYLKQTYANGQTGYNDQLARITGNAKVTVTLNLDTTATHAAGKNNNNDGEDGSLSISVNDGPTILMLNGLRSAVATGAGFLPAVVLMSSWSKVKVLNMNKLK